MDWKQVAVLALMIAGSLISLALGEKQLATLFAGAAAGYIGQRWSPPGGNGSGSGGIPQPLPPQTSGPFSLPPQPSGPVPLPPSSDNWPPPHR
jgi:hypothetical protein